MFQNAGPLERVNIPTDRISKKQKNFAFIVFQHEESLQYAFDLLNGTELFRQPLRLQNKTTGLGKSCIYTSSYYLYLLCCRFGRIQRQGARRVQGQGARWGRGPPAIIHRPCWRATVPGRGSSLAAGRAGSGPSERGLGGRTGLSAALGWRGQRCPVRERWRPVRGWRWK